MSDVLVITNNLRQASFRLRIESLQEPLARRGFQLHVQVRPRNLLARRRLLKSAGQFDAVILQRKLLEPMDLRLLKHQARYILYDIDDAVMLHSRPVGPYERFRTRRRFLATARTVDRVVAGNQYLARLFAEQGAPVTVLPTVVDPAHYALKSHAETRCPALVWIGSRSTLGYLRQFVPALAEAARRVPGLRLVTIADAALENPPLPTEHVPWSIDTEAKSLLGGDIGIAPTPEDPWTLGKCGFKIVQYMAAGLPTIASPVGANREIVADGNTGLLPAGAEDWPGAIQGLCSDVEIRKQFGSAARQRVIDQFSINRAADVWAGLLSRAKISQESSPSPRTPGEE
jgi:glycosyltransferase involved in cell wall biosynthesis